MAWESRIEVPTIIEHSTVEYLEALDKELRQQLGYREPEPTKEDKIVLKSSTDNDCGYIHQERKKGLGSLTEMTVDIKNGIVTGVDCYPANRGESDIILKYVKRQIDETGLEIRDIALDAGYDVGAVHRGFELMGITDYCSIRETHNNAMKKGFTYDDKTDRSICQKGCHLCYKKLIYKKGTQNYYRLYSIPRKNCLTCERLNHCAVDSGAIRINSSGFYPAYYANRQRCLTTEYQRMK